MENADDRKEFYQKLKELCRKIEQSIAETRMMVEETRMIAEETRMMAEQAEAQVKVADQESKERLQRIDDLHEQLIALQTKNSRPFWRKLLELFRYRSLGLY